MEYIKLSHTDLIISRLGFGCEPLGGTDWGKVDESQVVAAVSRALDLGINLFDTADVYGLGRSEQTLSRALGSRRHDVVIVSKFGVNWREDPEGGRAKTFLDCSPRRVMEAVESSLRRLRVDCIPLYLVHWPDPNTPIVETMKALVRCQESGKIRYIGVSNFPVHLIREAMQVTQISAVELQYNLINRAAERELLPWCQNFGIGVLAYGVLAQGLLTGKYDSSTLFAEDDRRHRLPHFQGDNLKANMQVIERVREVGKRYHRSPTQLAIRWALMHPAISCAITGIKSLDQIEENIGVFGWHLRREDYEFMANGVGA